MRVYLGSDHAGFALKSRLAEHLSSRGHDVVDCGPPDYRDGDDYPPYCLLVGTRVVADTGSAGIVIGGSGNGEAIAANKVSGVRCALAWSDDTARLAREHNDANVLSLGARMISEDDAVRFADIFLLTPFSAADRHMRRIALLAGYEASRELPPRREDLA